MNGAPADGSRSKLLTFLALAFVLGGLLTFLLFPRAKPFLSVIEFDPVVVDQQQHPFKAGACGESEPDAKYSIVAMETDPEPKLRVRRDCLEIPDTTFDIVVANPRSPDQSTE